MDKNSNFNQKYSIKSINNQFSEMALNPQQIRLKTKILSNGRSLTQQIVSFFNKTKKEDYRKFLNLIFLIIFEFAFWIPTVEDEEIF